MADWNSFSERYDGIFLESPHYRKTLDMMVDLVEEGDSKRFLDLGCGTGNLTRAILDNFPEASVFGVDPSPGMLDKCAGRFGGEAGVALSGGHALDIPFEEGKFDYVMTNLALHHLTPEERPRCAEEVVRVLKGGGRLVYADMFCGVDAPATDPERCKDIIERFANCAKYCVENGAYEMMLIILETLPLDIKEEGEYLATEEIWVRTLRATGMSSFEVIPVPPAGCGVSIISAVRD